MTEVQFNQAKPIMDNLTNLEASKAALEAVVEQPITGVYGNLSFDTTDVNGNPIQNAFPGLPTAEELTTMVKARITAIDTEITAADASLAAI